MRSFFIIFGPFIGGLAVAAVIAFFLFPALWNGVKSLRLNAKRNSEYTRELEEYRRQAEPVISALVVSTYSGLIQLNPELKEQLYNIKSIEGKK